MNNQKWIAVALLTLLVGAGVGYWWSHRQSTVSTEKAAGNGGERKVLYWHDPMVPNQKFDKPGKSPYMDMQLVPVYEDEVSADAGITVSSSVSQSLGIRIGKVERQIIKQTVSAVGSVAFDEYRVQLVQARVNGYITTLFVKAPLDRVRKGQPLAAITSPEWQAAEAEYAVLLKNNFAQSRELRTAARDRLRVLAVPESVIAEIERTHDAKSTTDIFAPIDGVVTELGVREGAAFMPGATLFRINGLETVWVNAQIPEAQVHVVPMGATIVAKATAWPGETFAGRVQALLPEVDASTRTLTVRALIENPHRKLSPGMFVSLDLTQTQGGSQLVVPSEAVIMTGQRTAVISKNENGSFNVVNVVTGGQVADKTIVLKGLSEGQPIVLSGQFLIDSEASLQSTIDRLFAAPSEQKQP